jgi:hydrogenase maturation protease
MPDLHPKEVEALGTAGRILIVGYGNTLRRDDGFGWRAAALLAEDPRLRGAHVHWQQQLTPELAVDVSNASLVVLVDVTDGEEAGTISVRRLDPTGGAGSAWTHHLEPEALIALARDLWNAAPASFVVSVGAASLEIGDHMSSAVEQALPAVVDAVVAIVAEHDHRRESEAGNRRSGHRAPG